MACAFDKLAQGCNALFVVGQSTISFVLKKVIIAFNVVFKNLFTWPSRNKMEMVM